MNLERLRELAALEAIGALTGEELTELESALTQADTSAKPEVAAFRNLAALLAVGLSSPQIPPPAMKQRLIERLDQHVKQKTAGDGIAPDFVLHRGADETGWQRLPLPGAWVKVLSLDRSAGYAMVLGKLEPGARYPAHRHLGSEEVYMLAGDLQMRDALLGPGDFHHAAPGTVHESNYSEHGCTLLAVVSVEDLMAQADPNSEKWIKS